MDLTFEQPIVANPDAFTYTASPLVIPASAGLLLNDINPASCAASPPTFSVDTPATKGTVLVSGPPQRLHTWRIYTHVLCATLSTALCTSCLAVVVVLHAAAVGTHVDYTYCIVFRIRLPE